MSDSRVRARCHCGGVVLMLALPSRMCGHCHCESCRRIHAAAFVTWTGFVRDQVRVESGQDMLRAYASSPNVTRQFCGRCGTQLLYVSSDEPEKVYIPRAAILEAEADADDTSIAFDREPECHVNMADAVPWLSVDDALPKFDRFD